MTRRATTIVIAAVIAGAGLVLFLRGTSNENETAAASSARAFTPQTSWGEPNLAGVWKGDPLGSRERGAPRFPVFNPPGGALP